MVVNDLGGSADGTGKGSAMADQVVDEIKAAGGNAVANYDSVSSKEGADNMIKEAIDAFGSIDIVVNKAGILRDISFAKMTEDHCDLVQAVHVKGSYYVTKAAWPHMREKGFETLDQLVGKAIPAYAEWGNLDINYESVARIDEAKCIGCQDCVVACMDGAHQCIHVDAADGNRVPHVDEDECDGCNLCQIVCPVPGCITLEQVDNGYPAVTWNQPVAAGTEIRPKEGAHRPPVGRRRARETESRSLASFQVAGPAQDLPTSGRDFEQNVVIPVA